MSYLIDTLSYYQNLPRGSNTQRIAFNFQTLTQYLSAYTNIQQSLKYFNIQGDKSDIVLQISIYKPLVSIIQKVHIDRRRLTYISKFILKLNSDLLVCNTKDLRLMVIKQLQTLKKKMKVYSYAITVDMNTGQIGGKHIFTIGTSTNLNQLLLCQFIPLKNHLNRFMTIVLSLINVLPPSYTQFINQKVRPLPQLWKSYSKAPSDFLQQHQDRQLQQRLQNQTPIIFQDDTSQLFAYRPDRKYRKDFKFQISTQQNSTIQIHLKLPVGSGKKNQNNFVFNQIKVLQQSNQSVDTGLRGGSTKIMISKLKFMYMNSLNNNFNNQNQTRQNTKLMAIKVPLDNTNIQRAIKKGQHQIKILKLFSQIQTPFLLRYFVSYNSNFKYNKLLMMNYIQNCDTFTSFLSKRKQILSFSSKLYVLINVLQALRLIKQYRVVHMDLSPGNILVNPTFITQLIDFGQSYHKDIVQQDYNPGYTLPFSFPQKFTSKHFTNKSDMFSFGIIVFYTIFKMLPYNPSLNLINSLKNNTYTKKFFFAPQAIQYYGYRKTMIFLFSFIQRCVDPSPLVRPHPGWSVILLKQLYFWLEQLAMVI